MTNKERNVLYIGVTNDLKRRAYEHKTGLNTNSFTSKYNCKYLIYFEIFENPSSAIMREKQLKNWHREWKLNLIKQLNPELLDLSKDWFE